MAKICGVQEPMEFMPYSELFDDLPDFFQVMSYKSYLQTTSVSMEGKIPLIPRRPGE
jgi:ABC-type antimicrobial peptide transport system ATPase subunit